MIKLIAAALIGAFTALALADFVPASMAVCKPDEGMVTCAREWSDFFAIMAGALVIYFTRKGIQAEAHRYNEAEQTQERKYKLTAGRTRAFTYNITVFQEELRKEIARLNAIFEKGDLDGADFSNHNLESIIKGIEHIASDDAIIRYSDVLDSWCLDTIMGIQDDCDRAETEKDKIKFVQQKHGMKTTAKFIEKSESSRVLDLYRRICDGIDECNEAFTSMRRSHGLKG